MKKNSNAAGSRWLMVPAFLFLIVTLTDCQSTKTSPVIKKSVNWAEIDTFFTPPPAYRNDPGTYASPLVFANGDTARTREQWGKRRTEILTKWQDLMGNWPELITDQELKITASEQKDGYVLHTVRFKWLPNEETRGYLLVPASAKKGSPAVITVFYEPETAIGVGGKPYRDFAIQLAKRGFVTLSLGTTEATKANTFSLYYPSIEKPALQPLSALAYAAANAWNALAKRPEVDPSRIGIVGHSFGGKWAMFASCLYEKFACAVWSDPGIVFQNDRESINYWEPWYLGFHPKPWRKRGLITTENPAYGLYPELLKTGSDLQELHALMAPRPFLVSGGAEDPVNRWQPLNQSIAVNRLLGYEKRVAMTNRPLHDPNAESNEVIYRFFEQYLK